MKVLIRNSRKGLYLAADGSWVKEIAEALDFERASAAIPYALAHGLRDVELVHAFAAKEYNFSFPLNDVATQAQVPQKS